MDWQEIRDRAARARDILGSCRLCGRACGADRLSGEEGLCGAGLEVRVAAHLLHFGEEPPISGERGSGTIFFSGCPLNCVFCQNWQISQTGQGRPVAASELAHMMLDLEKQGAHNINLVSPTPWAPQILEALAEARRRGLSLPLVYNTGGYDSPAALELMGGLIDVYLPDVKYAQPEAADRYSGAADYVEVNHAAVREMVRQTGPLTFDGEGMAVRGVLIRHLVLPGGLSGTAEVLRWLTDEFGPDLWMSLMAQYLPCHKVGGNGLFPEINRPLTEDEYDAVLDLAGDLGLENVFIQELTASETYVPDFETPEVFSRTE